MPDVEKLEGLYKGQISELQGKLREAQKAYGQAQLDLTTCKSGKLPTAYSINALIKALINLLKK